MMKRFLVFLMIALSTGCSSVERAIDANSTAQVVTAQSVARDSEANLVEARSAAQAQLAATEVMSGAIASLVAASARDSEMVSQAMGQMNSAMKSVNESSARLVSVNESLASSNRGLLGMVSDAYGNMLGYVVALVIVIVILAAAGAAGSLFAFRAGLRSVSRQKTRTVQKFLDLPDGSWVILPNGNKAPWSYLKRAMLEEQSRAIVPMDRA